MSGQRFIAGIRRHYVALILRAGQRPVLMALRLRECWRNIGNHRENSGISSPSSKNPHQIRKDHISAIQFVIKKKKEKGNDQQTTVQLHLPALSNQRYNSIQTVHSIKKSALMASHSVQTLQITTKSSLVSY